jgi:hypothetical protein
MPGLIKRGLKQFSEGWNENPGEIHLGHLDNFLGLLPMGDKIDDPCESIQDAIAEKLDGLGYLYVQFWNKPYDAAIKTWEWIIDFAI